MSNPARFAVVAGLVVGVALAAALRRVCGALVLAGRLYLVYTAP